MKKDLTQPLHTYPWSSVDDTPITGILSPYKFFSGYATESDPVSAARVAIRVAVLIALIAAVTVAGVNILVITTDGSVTSHECEDNYKFWLMAILNCAIYCYIIFGYFCCRNPTWLRAFAISVMLAMIIMFVWWFAAFTRMAKICDSFYSIKYPLLTMVANLNGGLNLIYLGLSCSYECFTSMKERNNLPDQADDMLWTNIFCQKDETWLPALFNSAEVSTYTVGVQKWSESIKHRNQTLEETLKTTQTIHEGSRSQSQLLAQVTNLVKETETKTTKTVKLMDEQDVLISDLKGVVDDVAIQLNTMPTSTGDISVFDCTKKDACSWCAFSLMCCFAIAFTLMAIPKWCKLFNIPCSIIGVSS